MNDNRLTELELKIKYNDEFINCALIESLENNQIDENDEHDFIKYFAYDILTELIKNNTSASENLYNKFKFYCSDKNCLTILEFINSIQQNNSMLYISLAELEQNLREKLRIVHDQIDELISCKSELADIKKMCFDNLEQIELLKQQI